MRMFRESRRERAARRASGPPPESDGEGGPLQERARSQATRHVEGAADRAHRAAAAGHTWSSLSPTRSAPAPHGPSASPAATASPSTRRPMPTEGDAPEPGFRTDPDRPDPDRPDPDRTAAAGGEVSAARARHDNATFAARARLAAHRAEQPRRKRIWELDDAGDVEDDAPPDGPREAPPPATPRPRPKQEELHEAGSDRALPPAQAPRPSPLPPAPGAAAEAEPDPRPQPVEAGAREDEVAFARAQLARMAELGLNDDAPGTARAKTRVLGFRPPEADDDPFGGAHAPAANRGPDYPVGWLVVTAGSGRGASFGLTAGVATLGRGEDQTVRLDFGDTAISRSAHASIAYDAESGRFFLGAGAKSNLVRRNGRPVLATEEIASGDAIRLGETTLRFVALCGDGFAWDDEPPGRA